MVFGFKWGSEGSAPAGRAEAIVISGVHAVSGRPMTEPPAEGLEEIWLGMGCFWGAERRFWQTPGVWVTAVGYAGGTTLNPNYREVCGGATGHTEVVRVIFDPSVLPVEALLKVFWESHDPTQGMRQGNDIGTQYRSAIYFTSHLQGERVRRSRDSYEAALRSAGRGGITTEILGASAFYYAEEYHQQYLQKNPDGYCGLRGTGVECRAAAPE